MKTKKHLLVILLVLSHLFLEGTLFAVDWSARWIWSQDKGPANAWMAFRKTFDLERVPETAIANIGVDSKYWLWINGRLVQFEGGIARGPSPGNTWYDEIAIEPYLKEGENTLALLVWYWGRQTNKGTHMDSGQGGLVFQADLRGTTLRSDATWKVKPHPAYDPNSGGGNKRLVPYNVFFDGRKGMGDWTASAWYSIGYDDGDWSRATEKGTPPCMPWGQLVKNEVPPLHDYGLADYASLRIKDNVISLPYTNASDAAVTIEARLPFNRQVTPALEIVSSAGKTIKIDTDNSRNAIGARYTTRSGSQCFETYAWMSGHAIRYEIPAGVEVTALKYRWTGVGTIVGDFRASDPFYQRLWWMGRNTLYICARDNFMDCPDRERALWIGDVADQASYLFYVMDEAGRQLLKKAIAVTMAYSRDKVFGALGPGRVRELPSQSLQFISMDIWPYYFQTGDIDTLRVAYPYVYDYLALWPMTDRGLPRYRKGASPDSWNWSDWGVKNTVDEEPMQFALYYMALKQARAMAEVLAEVLGQSDHLAWYDTRINAMHAGFNRAYWTGAFYSSDPNKFKDDRANTVTLLAGLADSDKYDSICDTVLIPVWNSSPHIEWMVEEALCRAGTLRRGPGPHEGSLPSAGRASREHHLVRKLSRGRDLQPCLERAQCRSLSADRRHRTDGRGLAPLSGPA